MQFKWVGKTGLQQNVFYKFLLVPYDFISDIWFYTSNALDSGFERAYPSTAHLISSGWGPARRLEASQQPRA